MVDPIGLKPVPANDRRVSAVTRTSAPTGTTSGDLPTQAPLAGGTVASAKEFAATPPIDYERVTRIRKAIEDGRFPIVPAQIADRLIAAKLDWARDDAS